MATKEFSQRKSAWSLVDAVCHHAITSRARQGIHHSWPKRSINLFLFLEEVLSKSEAYSSIIIVFLFLSKKKSSSFLARHAMPAGHPKERQKRPDIPVPVDASVGLGIQFCFVLWQKQGARRTELGWSAGRALRLPTRVRVDLFPVHNSSYHCRVLLA